MEIVVKYWMVGWGVLTTIVMVIMALLSKTYAKKDDLTELERKVATLDSLITDLPTKSELHELHIEIANLRGELKALSPRLERVQHMSDLLLENELKEKS